MGILANIVPIVVYKDKNYDTNTYKNDRPPEMINAYT